MKMTGYAIYDVKAETFACPVFQNTEGFAVRAFERSVTDPDSPWSKNPEDYSLWSVCEIETDEAVLYDQVNRQIITGLEAVANVHRREAKLRSLQMDIEDLTNPEVPDSPGGTQ